MELLRTQLGNEITFRLFQFKSPLARTTDFIVKSTGLDKKGDNI
jgi:hypothetical protein